MYTGTPVTGRDRDPSGLGPLRPGISNPRRRRIGNHKAHNTTVTEAGPSGGPVEREPGLTEASVSYDL